MLNNYANANYYNMYLLVKILFLMHTNTSTHKVKFTARHENNGNGLEADSEMANVSFFR
jgi:hypothetical protein